MLKVDAPLVAMKKQKKRSTLHSLPEDMLIEVAMQVASKSPTPIQDIGSLRATCKRFLKATKDKLVGRSIAVSKESKMPWYQTDAYLALLRRCAECANLEANFILGFEEIYNLGMKTQGLEHLTRATDGGHLTAAYLLGITLFLNVETRSDGMEILNKLSFGNLLCPGAEVTECTRSGNPLVDRCRRAAIEIARGSWKEWEMQPRSMLCRDQSCGRVIKTKDVDLWLEKDRLPRAYCSQICRWTDECNMFFRKQGYA